MQKLVKVPPREPERIPCTMVLRGGGTMCDGENGMVDAIVLIPGACHGKWVWAPLIDELKQRGAPSIIPEDLMGLCSRTSELNEAVNLTSHVNDLVQLLETKDVRKALLVGHSYGTNVMVGAADRAPERVHSMIFLDGPLPGTPTLIFSLCVP